RDRFFPGLKEMSVEECDAVLVFCPIVSRAGTDISAALQKLDAYKESKPTVLVILHQTLNPEFFVPENSRSVNRENTLTVDCLFQEGKGLLRCDRNQEALDKVTQWIRPLIVCLNPSPNLSLSDRRHELGLAGISTAFLGLCQVRWKEMVCVLM
uniref:Uncharacterized protein n=1 Tax=Astyanax mexicanus TaxID=7994 RepID=A0A8B9JF21_ASTMX